MYALYEFADLHTQIELQHSYEHQRSIDKSFDVVLESTQDTCLGALSIEYVILNLSIR